MEWIDIKTKLPEYDKVVILRGIEHDRTHNAKIQFITCGCREFTDVNGDSYFTINFNDHEIELAHSNKIDYNNNEMEVTHWMELPKYP